MHDLVQKSVSNQHFSAPNNVNIMFLQREILEKLRRWKTSSVRKPILLKGARQVGKTRVMEQFGKECFKYSVKFDFDRQPELKEIFRNSKEPHRIIKELSLYCEKPIIAEETLIIFDEIQECEEALNSLKYFYEDAPEYAVIAAGSLLGVAVKKKNMAVPVGKVTVMRMYPLSFKEFLYSSDISTYNYIQGLKKIDTLPNIILNKLVLEYNRYTVSGGMPEAVIALLENRGIETIEKILQDILDLYELDFSKYAAGREIPRIHAIWHSLPSQLAKEHRKFIYHIIRNGARSKDYEDALMWLEDAGLIYRIYDISKPALPLSAYLYPNAFKVYACDCGLLRRMARLPASVINDPLDSYTEFKGAIAENLVLQSLLPQYENETIAYWTSEGKAEVDFVLQTSDRILPIEVKANNNISGKSLYVYSKKYNPSLMIRASLDNISYKPPMLNVPSPLISWLNEILKEC